MTLCVSVLSAVGAKLTVTGFVLSGKEAAIVGAGCLTADSAFRVVFSGFAVDSSVGAVSNLNTCPSLLYGVMMANTGVPGAMADGSLYSLSTGPTTVFFVFSGSS